MATIVTNPTPTLTEGAKQRAVCFNLRCTGEGTTSVEFRAPLLIAQVLAYEPDTIGFQEATPLWMELLREGLSEKYAYVGVAREDGKDKGEYNPVFYNREKYELLDSGTIWLSKTPGKPSRFCGSACIRICTWATLRDKGDGSVFSHINTHLDHVSEKARLKQTDVLLNKVAELEKQGPVVCTGDFNVYEGSEVYKRMCSEMTDSKYQAPVSDHCGTFHDYNEEGIEDKLPIDFVFLKNGFNALRYTVIRDKIDGVHLSDHYGIFTDLSL